MRLGFMVEKDVIKRLRGIYMIVCLRGMRVYVGSTKNMLRRFHEHKNQLALGKHGCTPLQNAYNKYGSLFFEFYPLEGVANADIILEREQDYIDTLGAHASKGGFNVCKIAGGAPEQSTEDLVRRGLEIRGREFEIESPDGQIVRFKGVKTFAREKRLDAAQLQRVLNGSNLSVKGWHLPGTSMPPSRVIIDPLGNEIVIPHKGIKAFASKAGLNASALSRMMGGYVEHYKGYCLPCHRDRFFIPLVSPDGRRVLCLIKRRNMFRAKYGLKCATGLANLISGKRKSHQGWTRADPC